MGLLTYSMKNVPTTHVQLPEKKYRMKHFLNDCHSNRVLCTLLVFWVFFNSTLFMVSTFVFTSQTWDLIIVKNNCADNTIMIEVPFANTNLATIMLKTVLSCQSVLEFVHVQTTLVRIHMRILSMYNTSMLD